MLEQFVLEYRGFSISRGRGHVILDRASSRALVGDPNDNPGTSVTKAIEEVAFELRRCLDVDVEQGELYQYVPWDPRRRRAWIAEVKFMADAWSMPVWTDADMASPFVHEVFKVVQAIQPYSLSNMSEIELINGLVRVRIEASTAPEDLDAIRRAGSIEHVSQRRWFYVDVSASDEETALTLARTAVAPRIPSDRVVPTTPNAPLDQPGSLPGSPFG